VDRVIAHTLLRLAPPKCPTKYTALRGMSGHS